MESLQDLKKIILKDIEKYPEHRQELADVYMTCVEEIEDGGSAMHEIGLALTDLCDKRKEWEEERCRQEQR